MILIDILKKIFGKKKKAVKPTPPVIYTPPTPNVNPNTGEVIDQKAVDEIDAIIDFNRGLVLLERQKEAYRNLYMKIYKNYADDIRNNAPNWQIDQHRNEEKALLNAQNLDTKIAAKKCVDAYKLITNYATKLDLYTKYNILRDFFTGSQTMAYGIYNVLSNVGFEIIEPVRIENKNDFGLQFELFNLRKKQLGQLGFDYYNKETQINNSPKSNPTEADIFNANLEKNERLNKYNLSKEKLIKEIQERAANLVRLFNVETVTTVKQKYANDYNPLRIDLNNNFDVKNILVGANYAMTFAVTTTPTTREAENPNTGGTMQQGTNTGAQATTTTPFNDGRYPNWTNKDYTPNTTVYFEGKLYKTIQSVYGNNNNTPNLDGRWVIL